jgi:hypothetical protein
MNLLHLNVEVDPIWIEGTVDAMSFPALGLLIASRRLSTP